MALFMELTSPTFNHTRKPRANCEWPERLALIRCMLWLGHRFRLLMPPIDKENGNGLQKPADHSGDEHPSSQPDCYRQEGLKAPGKNSRNSLGYE